MKPVWSAALSRDLRLVLPVLPTRDPALVRLGAHYQYLVFSEVRSADQVVADVLVRCVDRVIGATRAFVIHPTFLLQEISDVTGTSFEPTFNKAGRAVQLDSKRCFDTMATFVACSTHSRCPSNFVMRTWFETASPADAARALQTTPANGRCVLCGDYGHVAAECCQSTGTVRIFLSINRTRCADAPNEMLRLPIVPVVPADDAVHALFAS